MSYTEFDIQYVTIFSIIRSKTRTKNYHTSSNEYVLVTYCLFNIGMHIAGGSGHKVGETHFDMGLKPFPER